VGLLAALLDPWAWRMAWRDSRHSRRRLLLYAASITVGVAALVAIGSYGDNMRARRSRTSSTSGWWASWAVSRHA
jgi:predicted lysophospholipase L1 biosynthesis ABC-type transport system permease subunit